MTNDSLIGQLILAPNEKKIVAKPIREAKKERQLHVTQLESIPSSLMDMDLREHLATRLKVLGAVCPSSVQRTLR